MLGSIACEASLRCWELCRFDLVVTGIMQFSLCKAVRLSQLGIPTIAKVSLTGRIASDKRCVRVFIAYEVV